MRRLASWSRFCSVWFCKYTIQICERTVPFQRLRESSLKYSISSNFFAQSIITHPARLLLDLRLEPLDPGLGGLPLAGPLGRYEELEGGRLRT